MECLQPLRQLRLDVLLLHSEQPRVGSRAAGPWRRVVGGQALTRLSCEAKYLAHQPLQLAPRLPDGAEDGRPNGRRSRRQEQGHGTRVGMRVFEELYLEMEAGERLDDPVVRDGLARAPGHEQRAISGAIQVRPRLSEEPQSVLEVDAGRGEVSAEKIQGHKDDAGDESHATRRAVLGREVRLQVADGPDVVPQRRLLEPVGDVTAAPCLAVALQHPVPVHGAQGEGGVQDGRLGDARLHDEGGPEVRDERARQLSGDAAPEPVKGALVLGAGREDRDAGARDSGSGAVARHRQGLAACVVVAAASPDAVPVADAAGRDTAGAGGESLVAFYFADSGAVSSGNGRGDRRGEELS